MRKLIIKIAVIIIAALVAANLVVYLWGMLFNGISMILDDIQELKRERRHDNKC